MPIPFKCPTCGAVGHVPSSAAGLHIGCPKCKALLEVPKQAGVADVPRSAPYSSPPPVRKPPGASKAADQPAGLTHAACPYCGEQILAHAKKCKHCGEILDAELRASRQGKRSTPASRYEDDDEPDYDSPARPRESGTDPFGVISLIFGSLAVVCMLMGCFTCGITYFAAAPFAAVRAGLAFSGVATSRWRHSF